MKRYVIPIEYQRVEYLHVDADNLQEAVEKALQEFFKIPDDNYIEDSFDISSTVEYDYKETFDLNKALNNI